MSSTTTTTTTETHLTESLASTPPPTYGKLRYIPAGQTPTPSPHNFHLPAISEFSDVRSMPLTDMRPVPTVDQLPHAKQGTAQLSTHGFTAVRHPSAMHSVPYSRASWNDPKLLSEIYVPETEEMVKRITGAKTVITEGLLIRSAIWTEQDALATHAGHGKKETEEESASKKQPEEEDEQTLCFPQFVGFSPSTGGASPAPKVHLDYAPNGARAHIRKYHPKLTAAATPIIAAEDSLLSQSLPLKEHYAATPTAPRWALFSIWRPLKPVRRDPLALGDARTFAQEDYVPIDVRTPNLGVPGKQDVHVSESYLARGRDSHEWYWISGQMPEEVLVIGLFDSEREKETVAAGGTLHSSVDLEGTEMEEARESLELRCLAIW
jgi:hypothetical protein